MVQLDELRSILLSERETGRLVQVPHDLFISAMREVEALMKEVYACEDPFSDRSRMKIERVNSIRETLQDLFRIRAEKILGFAYAQEEGQPVERDEKKRMLPGEVAMFDTITLAIRNCRAVVIGSAGMTEWETPGECPPIVPQDTGAPGKVTGLSPDFALVRVLSDMEPFMGVDGRIYHLQKEDLVTLPGRNADVLRERNIVLTLE
jgi:DNA replication factor GINS